MCTLREGTYRAQPLKRRRVTVEEVEYGMLRLHLSADSPAGEDAAAAAAPPGPPSSVNEREDAPSLCTAIVPFQRKVLRRRRRKDVSSCGTWKAAAQGRIAVDA